MILNYIVDKNNKYEDINQVLNQRFGISNRLLVKLIKNKKVLLNNMAVDTRTKLKINDSVTVLLDLEEDNSNIMPSNKPIDIVYEDDALLIVNKPAGIAIHPSILHYETSLSNRVKFYFDTIKLNKKIRPVNRLDLNTSGLVIFAKCEYVQEFLIRQMKANVFKKEYLGLVDGILENKKGKLDFPIARKQNSIIERCVNENGKPSVTYFETLKEYNNYALVKFRLETGRTHQIRVHMSYIGHPLLGDTLYGKKSNLLSRHALHCYKLTFVNPIRHHKMTLTCNPPKDFLDLTK